MGVQCGKLSEQYLHILGVDRSQDRGELSTADTQVLQCDTEGASVNVARRSHTAGSYDGKLVTEVSVDIDFVVVERDTTKSRAGHLDGYPAG